MFVAEAKVLHSGTSVCTPATQLYKPGFYLALGFILDTICVEFHDRYLPIYTAKYNLLGGKIFDS